MLAAGLVLGLAACSAAPKSTEESKAEASQTEASQTESSQEESSAAAPESTASAPEQVSLAGVWTSVAASMDGEALSESELAEYKATLTLYADGTLKLENSMVSHEGTWSETADGVQINSEGYSVKAELSGSQLILIEESDQMTFERTGDAPAQQSAAVEPEQISFAGVWETVAVTQDGTALSESELAEVHSTLTLYADGTLTLENSMVSREGTWSEAENGVQIDSEGYNVKAELSGSQLVIDSEEDGVVMTLERTGDAPAKGGADA